MLNARRQAEMDYALSEALKYNTSPEDIKRVLVLYDIMCKYGLHVLRRFRLGSKLNWPEFNEFIKGVGVWHIYAHIKECFPRFSPLFLPRVGLVDGEVVETIWSNLNSVTNSCRTMSLANRAETINAHMNNINWHKIIGMSEWHLILFASHTRSYTISIKASTLLRKWKKAVKLTQQRKRTLTSLNQSCTHEDRRRWMSEVEEAMRLRREGNTSAMDILVDKGDERKDILPLTHTDSKHIEPPGITRKLVELRLGEEEAINTENSGRVRHIADGISLQEEQ